MLNSCAKYQLFRLHSKSYITRLHHKSQHNRKFFFAKFAWSFFSNIEKLINGREAVLIYMS